MPHKKVEKEQPPALASVGEKGEDPDGTESASVEKDFETGRVAAEMAQLSTVRFQSFGTAVDMPISDAGEMLSMLGLREKIGSARVCKTEDEIENLSMESESQIALAEQLVVALKNGLKACRRTPLSFLTHAADARFAFEPLPTRLGFCVQRSEIGLGLPP